MSDYTKINAYFAKKCGVEHRSFGHVRDGGEYGWHWSIRDPRCREIVREKFRLTTTPSQIDGTFTCSRFKGLSCLSTAMGGDIEAAELACLEAIYNQRGEHE